MGPNNPLTLYGQCSYTVPPKDWNDYYAFKHDQGYDKLGAAGPMDALFNPVTLNEDYLFAHRMLTNPQTSNTVIGKMSGYLFSEIVGFKLNLILMQLQMPLH